MALSSAMAKEEMVDEELCRKVEEFMGPPLTVLQPLFVHSSKFDHIVTYCFRFVTYPGWRVVLVSVFLNLQPRGGRGSWSYLPVAPPADLLSQSPGKNASNSHWYTTSLLTQFLRAEWWG